MPLLRSQRWGWVGVGLLPTSHPYGVCEVPISKSRRDGMSVETGISPISSKPCKGDISVETGITTFGGFHAGGWARSYGAIC
jgi:hypothetical protein